MMVLIFSLPGNSLSCILDEAKEGRMAKLGLCLFGLYYCGQLRPGTSPFVIAISATSHLRYFFITDFKNFFRSHVRSHLNNHIIMRCKCSYC